MSTSPGETTPIGQSPRVIAVSTLLEWYRQQFLIFEGSQEEFRALSQIPTAERDPKINEMAGRISGIQEVLTSFSKLVISSAGVETDTSINI